MIVLRETDFDQDLKLDSVKKAAVESASAELVLLGEQVVPQLIELAGLSKLSTPHECETGWNAVRILISIGQPAVQHIREAHLPEDLREFIVESIESNGKRNRPKV